MRGHDVNAHAQHIAGAPHLAEARESARVPRPPAVAVKGPAARILAQAKAEAEQTFRQQAEARKVTDRRAALEKEGKSIEGFEDVIATLFEDHDFPMSPAMAGYLLDDADNGALLAKWLTDNPDEAKRIADLRPLAAAKELTRRDGLLARKTAKPISKAPAPTPSVSGSGSAPQAFETMAYADVLKQVREWNRK